ncbi:hypothetical protein ACVW0I_005676 [Bradyrhizobium sp. LM6.11]
MSSRNLTTPGKRRPHYRPLIARANLLTIARSLRESIKLMLSAHAAMHQTAPTTNKAAKVVGVEYIL